MTYRNEFCADVGTVNCPCPLAETGDCLICSRLAGKECCDCCWAGVCVYNEYIQNDKIIRGRRENDIVPILKKIWYGRDLLVLVLKVSKGFALKAAQPGSFVFVNVAGKSEFSNVPLSVMKADVEKGQLRLALKVISGKTKAIAEEESALLLRGVYRNGILGKGAAFLKDDVKEKGKKWLMVTKGIGFAPAANLLTWAEGRVQVDLLVDTEKVNDEIIRDHLMDCVRDLAGSSFRTGSLCELTASLCTERAKGHGASLGGRYSANDYDRVILLISDYYIKALAEHMDIPGQKLVFSNNFRMCCGEGICGACSHIDDGGQVSKMCKCREADVRELC